MPRIAGGGMPQAKKVETSLTERARAAGAGLGVLRESTVASLPARDRSSALPATARTRCRSAPRCVAGGRRDGLRCLRTCARDVPGSGLRPVVLMTISDRWSGIRTRDTWITSPLLYPSELSRGQRAGLEPATDSIQRCCSPFEPTLSQSDLAGIGIRHGSAARTGRGPNPHRCCRWIPTAYCRFSGGNAWRRIAPRPAPRHPGAAPCAGVSPHRRVSASLATGQHGPGASGSRDARVFEKSFANARTKNAPGMESEGIRRASEDRGDRSPVEEPVRSG